MSLNEYVEKKDLHDALGLVIESLTSKMWWIIGLLVFGFFADIILGIAYGGQTGIFAVINFAILFLRFFISGDISKGCRWTGNNSRVLNMVLAFFFPLIMIWIMRPRFRAYYNMLSIEVVEIKSKLH